MKLASSLDRLGTESAFSVLAEAKKLEAAGNPMIHLGLVNQISKLQNT